MNNITLKGIIRNIQPSHKINDIEYNKAEIIVKRKDNKEDLINLRFKKFSNSYKENDDISLCGNIRSFSQQLEGKNKVDIYVFTYFDEPQEEYDCNNYCELDGRICKIDELRVTQSGKHNIHFILANNIVKDNNQKLNSYIPCIAWGKTAKQIAELSVNTQLKIVGELHSREYKKKIANDEIEIHVAHELLITEFEVIE